MCLAIEAVASDRTFFQTLLAGIQRHPVQTQTSQSRTTVPSLKHSYACPLATSPITVAGHSLKPMTSSREQTQPIFAEKIKASVNIYHFPRPRGNEISSPGKAPRPFPLRCCAIEERVWLQFVSGSGGLGKRLPCTWKFSRDEIFANCQLN